MNETNGSMKSFKYVYVNTVFFAGGGGGGALLLLKLAGFVALEGGGGGGAFLFAALLNTEIPFPLPWDVAGDVDSSPCERSGLLFV